MKQYKISAFAKMMGVSVDLVKHYQQEGIITPIVDTENNYRYYNIRHGEKIITSRRFRTMGFNLKETKQLISELSGEEIHENLTAKENEIQEEIERLISTKNRITELKTECETFLNEDKEQFLIITRPAYYYIPHTCDKEFISDKELQIQSELWMSKLPYAIKMAKITYDKSTDETTKYWGLGLEEKYFIQFGLNQSECIEYFPKTTCVRRIYSGNKTDSYANEFKSILNWIKEQGYELSNEQILTQNSIDFFKNGCRTVNYYADVPIKMEEK